MAESTTSTNIPQWLQDFYSGVMTRGQQVGGMPYQQPQFPLTAPPTGQEQDALRMIQQRAVSGSPIAPAQTQLVTDTLQGKYLQNNPYMDAVVGGVSGDLQRQYEQSVAPQLAARQRQSGAFGNSGLGQQELNAQNQLLEQQRRASTDIRAGDYSAERQRQLQTMLFAPQAMQSDYQDANALLGAGGYMRGINQGAADRNYGEFQRSQQWPFQTLDAYRSSVFGSPSMGSSTTTTTPDPSRGGQILGGGLLGAGIGNMIGATNLPYFGNVSQGAMALGGGLLGGLLGGFL